MTKTVTNIPVPPEWESTNDWDSHRPLLYLAASKAKHRIVEFGCGDGSTPMLKNICEEYGGVFESVETNKEWASKFNKTILVDSYLDYNIDGINVMFVDLAPGELRKDIINKFSNLSQVIVVHDTEIGAEYVYGMSEVLSTFKYRFDYQPVGKPHTTAVSNTIDVTKWVD